MKFQGALIKEQGVRFAIVSVKSHVLGSGTERARMQRSLAQVFGGVPVVLMAQDSRGMAKYWGRRDIVKFLKNVPMRAIPWKQYSMN